MYAQREFVEQGRFSGHGRATDERGLSPAWLAIRDQLLKHGEFVLALYQPHALHPSVSGGKHHGPFGKKIFNYSERAGCYLKLPGISDLGGSLRNAVRTFGLEMAIQQPDDLVHLPGEEEVTAGEHLKVERPGGVLGPHVGLVQGRLRIIAAHQDGDRAVHRSEE